METLYIVIGAFSSIFIFLLGYSVSGVFNGKKKVDDLEKYIESTDMRISELERELNEKIDRNIDVLVNDIGTLDKDIYSHIDSRLDKLENKVNIRFNDNSAFVDKINHSTEDVKQQLNEFIRTYQNQ